MEEKNTITITVKYMVNLAEKAGRKEEEIGLPAGSTLAAASRWLMENRDITLPSPSIMATLNGKGWSQYPEKERTPLGDGDKVMLFPPISGG